MRISESFEIHREYDYRERDHKFVFKKADWKDRFQRQHSIGRIWRVSKNSYRYYVKPLYSTNKTRCRGRATTLDQAVQRAIQAYLSY